MSTTIHVDIACACDAAELVEFLETRGLHSEITGSNDHCELEVGYAVDPEARLCAEFEAALAAWLAGRERPLVPAGDLEHGYLLRPPAG